MEQWKESLQSTYSGLVRALPDNVHLLTVEEIGDEQVLIRLENFFEKTEMNKTASVNLNGLFKDFQIVSLVEMNLSANQFLKDKQMWEWDTMGGQFHADGMKPHTRGDMIVELKPMEIRTFIAKITTTTDNPPPMEFHQIPDEIPGPIVL